MVFCYEHVGPRSEHVCKRLKSFNMRSIGSIGEFGATSVDQWSHQVHFNNRDPKHPQKKRSIIEEAVMCHRKCSLLKIHQVQNQISSLLADFLERLLKRLLLIIFLSID